MYAVVFVKEVNMFTGLIMNVARKWATNYLKAILYIALHYKIYKS